MADALFHETMPQKFCRFLLAEEEKLREGGTKHPVSHVQMLKKFSNYMTSEEFVEMIRGLEAEGKVEIVVETNGGRRKVYYQTGTGRPVETCPHCHGTGKMERVA